MPEMLLILCTCPDEAVAAQLARGLVERKLAACVNLLPGIRSVYRWQGAVSEDAEVLLLVKSMAEKFGQLESWLLERHPYETPEIVAIPVSRVSAAYLAWVAASVGQAPG